MEVFSLPNAAKVQRVIPKNAFDAYTNAKQKKLFTDLIARITWLYKLSPDTVNLEAREIKEIQIFKVELKVMEEIQIVLDIIDKSIPYHIIFMVEYDGRIYLSTSVKHPHPLDENKAVIDWTFKIEWFDPSENKYALRLKGNLDSIYLDFCNQLATKLGIAYKSLHDLVQHKKQVDSLEKEIIKLKASIANSKQFNHKVEFNIRLKVAERELSAILGNHQT